MLSVILKLLKLDQTPPCTLHYNRCRFTKVTYSAISFWGCWSIYELIAAEPNNHEHDLSNNNLRIAKIQVLPSIQDLTFCNVRPVNLYSHSMHAWLSGSYIAAWASYMHSVSVNKSNNNFSSVMNIYLMRGMAAGGHPYKPSNRSWVHLWR